MLNRDEPNVESHLDLEKRVRERAHEIWQSRGHHHGQDTSLNDWLQAEQEVLGVSGADEAQDRGTVVGSAYAPSQDPPRRLNGDRRKLKKGVRRN